MACALWLAGFEVLPWLHVAMHDDLAPHVHAADGTIIRVSFDEPTHRHADGTIHRHGHAPDKRGRHKPPIGYTLDHGAGSLAHHGVAVQPPAAPIVHALPIDRRPQLSARVARPSLVSCAVPVAAARGPPAFAS